MDGESGDFSWQKSAKLSSKEDGKCQTMNNKIENMFHDNDKDIFWSKLTESIIE